MKTTKLFLTLAVAVVAAAFNTSLQAADVVLSPRAQENQTRTVAGVTENRLDRTDLFQHKADVAFPTRISSMATDRDLVRESRGLTGSPKALATRQDLSARPMHWRLADSPKAPAAMPTPARSSVATDKEMAACKNMKKGECAMPCCKTTGTCKMPCC